ncbi:hypothetical protein CJP74_06540 [Psittacicella melopsittaci]|uniref:N-acetyltransferase domain-containing protein n=1 Tax=Psittacicella melopsittaci TaxID=2028576 RepID=A0A3A1Y2D5_9GAMM|nr:N-acetyltransferase [Psittacicella melopsittaci]RIY31725.1 hypothetical protein CJP74_06540 [Psittacicella melopsittaci]
MSLKNYLNYLQLSLLASLRVPLEALSSKEVLVCARPLLGADIYRLAELDLLDNLDPWVASTFANYGAQVDLTQQNLTYRQGLYGVVLERLQRPQGEVPPQSNLKQEIAEFAQLLFNYRQQELKVNAQVDLAQGQKFSQQLTLAWKELQKAWQKDPEQKGESLNFAPQVLNVLAREYNLDRKLLEKMEQANFAPWQEFFAQYLAPTAELVQKVLQEQMSLAASQVNWLAPSFASFKPELSKRQRQAYLQHEQIIGFMCFDAQFEMLNLDNITVNPLYRKSGYAQVLLDIMFAFGTLQQTSNYLLEVRESNYPAINLYQKNGFVLLNKRHNYYDHSLNGQAEHALIYQKLCS